MVKMADIERIRWLALREGWSIRRIAKEMKLNRRTVAKWLNRPEVPAYTREDERPKPALGDSSPLVGVRADHPRHRLSHGVHGVDLDEPDGQRQPVGVGGGDSVPAMIACLVTAAILLPLLLLWRPAPKAERRPVVRNNLIRLGLYLSKRFPGLWGEEGIERRLIWAGRPENLSAAEFIAMRVVAAALGLVLGSLLGGVSVGILGGLVGAMAPDYWLHKRIKQRQILIARDLSEFLDAWVEAVDSGLDLMPAVEQVAANMPGHLSDEFRLAGQEVMVGYDRTLALQNVASRCGVPELTQVMATLTSAERFGTSVADQLRAAAQQLHAQRLARARAKAAQIGVAMRGPLTLLILPGLFIRWERFKYGVFLFVLGMGKKVLLADNLSPRTENFFASWSTLNGLEAWIAGWLFAFQIFCDFSAYSEMALGIGHMFGMELAVNFHTPYLSGNPSEFWRRWHITLSTWIRDYLYIPLGGSRKGSLRAYGNLIAAMALSGLWHGAAWTFVAWGLFHGVLSAVHRLWTVYVVQRKDSAVFRSKVVRWVSVVLMFQATTVGWIFFRATGLDEATALVGRMFSPSLWQVTPLAARYLPVMALFYFLHVAEFWLRMRESALSGLWHRWVPTPLRALAYTAVGALLLVMTELEQVNFIYFRF